MRHKVKGASGTFVAWWSVPSESLSCIDVFCVIFGMHVIYEFYD